MKRMVNIANWAGDHADPPCLEDDEDPDKKLDLPFESARFRR